MFSFKAVGLLFGLSMAAFISLTSIVLVELMGLDALTSSFGLVSCFRGVSAVLGPPLAGAAFDATDDYAIVFGGAAALFMAAAACGQAASFIIACRRKRRRDK